jgi:hypothetical protein
MAALKLFLTFWREAWSASVWRQWVTGNTSTLMDLLATIGMVLALNGNPLAQVLTSQKQSKSN